MIHGWMKKRWWHHFLCRFTLTSHLRLGAAELPRRAEVCWIGFTADVFSNWKVPRDGDVTADQTSRLHLSVTMTTVGHTEHVRKPTGRDVIVLSWETLWRFIWIERRNHSKLWTETEDLDFMIPVWDLLIQTLESVAPIWGSWFLYLRFWFIRTFD